MTETQQRFLRAIAERVPMEHVVELHLFPPIRQGGVETGVAVVAEDPKRPVPVPASDDTEPLQAAPLNGAVAIGRDAPEPERSAAAADAADGRESIDADDSPYANDVRDEDEDSDVDDYDVVDDDEDDDDGADEEDDDDDDVLTGAQESAARVAARFTIHTARYRLTLKGVDRGKWEVDVVAEADAPLDAVDAVVRGVQRRAGEGAEPDRLSTDAFRDALEAPLASLER